MSTNKKNKNKKQTDPKIDQSFSIDCTPKWADIILIHAVAAVDGETIEGVRAGREELIRCAQAADKYNELVREMKKNKKK